MFGQTQPRNVLSGNMTPAVVEVGRKLVLKPDRRDDMRGQVSISTRPDTSSIIKSTPIEHPHPHVFAIILQRRFADLAILITSNGIPCNNVLNYIADQAAVLRQAESNSRSWCDEFTCEDELYTLRLRSLAVRQRAYEMSCVPPCLDYNDRSAVRGPAKLKHCSKR